MLEKLKANQNKIVSNIGSALIGAVLCGIVGTYRGEVAGYSTLVIYLYGVFGHSRIANLIENKIGKK